MIEQNVHQNQLPNEIKPAFKELKVLQHLKTACFRKKFGYSCSFLFQLVFVLLFHHKNWFRLLESDRGDSFPGKDAVYRFLNHSGYAWRRFLSLLSSSTIEKVHALTRKDRVSVFVVDDSMFERNRSKAVELLSRFKDHATGSYYKGFRMLTLGWSDGHTFIPVDFSLLASLRVPSKWHYGRDRQANVRLQATAGSFIARASGHTSYDRSCAFRWCAGFLCAHGQLVYTCATNPRDA